ncbi:DNA repair protein RecO [Aliagarivorans marinus]|uniref:DNA repair protein RecO n=1 Tax=Aliagarivorans marinus TaxID=561965 RepID=UPI0003F53F38|nr:DNA repair protein RecO [Aliagarivorans marinus]
MASHDLSPAFVLHSRAYRETSLLVTFFSESRGKLTAVARGARNKRSPLRSLLQPGAPLLVGLSAGNGGLVNLLNAESQTLALPLFGKHLFSALYVNELLYHLLDEHSPYPELYQCYRQCLLELAAAKPIERSLRQFEFQLFRELGFALSLPEDWLPQQNYSYSLSRGFYPAQGHSSYSGEQIAQLCNFIGSDEQLPLARQFCRQLIAQLLNGRELRSRALFKQISPAQDAGEQQS